MKKALAIISAAALLAGCQMADNAFGPSGKIAKQFYGTIAGETRTVLAQDGEVYHVNWQMGDQIMVTDGVLMATYKAGEGGSPASYFSFVKGDTLTAGPYTAYYPADVQKGIAGVQEYGNVTVPMMAQSADENLSFKNLGSLLKLNVKTGESGVAVKYLIISADEPMAGAFTVVDNAAVVTEGTGVTISCGEGVAIGTTEVPFFAAVAPGTYNNLTVKMVAADGRSQTLKIKAGNAVTAVRSQYHEINLEFNKLEAAPALGGDAFLPDGPVFCASIKQLYDPLATEATIDNSNIKKIVFDTRSILTNGIRIEDISSDNPVYASFDAGSGVVTISTPAETLYTSSDASFMFNCFGALREIVNLKCLNTENAETMQSMFCMDGCDSSYIKSLDLSSFNTSNVYTFRSTFNKLCALESIDLSNFDTSNAETMRFMFRNCTTLKSIDLSKFDVENVTELYGMFYNCLSLENVNTTGWNTENVGNFGYMFYKCWGLTSMDLSHFDTSCCTNFDYMFWFCRNLKEVNVDGWDTSSATTMQNLFGSCYELVKMDIRSFSIESIMPNSSKLLNGLSYFFQQLGALEEIWLGPDFCNAIDILPPSTIACGSASQAVSSHRTGTWNTTGTIIIHCNQDVADWCARTALRWINTGYSTFEKPVPISFVDIDTGAPLTVTWRDN